MKTTNAKMNCPNCGTEINVDELLISQFQDSIKKDLESTNQYIQAVALNSIGEVCTPFMCRELAPEIMKLLTCNNNGCEK